MRLALTFALFFWPASGALVVLVCPSLRAGVGAVAIVGTVVVAIAGLGYLLREE